MLFARRSLLGFLVVALAAGLAHADSPNTAAEIRTPKAAGDASHQRAARLRRASRPAISLHYPGDRPAVHDLLGRRTA